jgi:hypothetical protein
MVPKLRQTNELEKEIEIERYRAICNLSPFL